MNSSWDYTRERSKYHFDPRRVDRKADVIQSLGQLPVTWAADMESIIEHSEYIEMEKRLSSINYQNQIDNNKHKLLGIFYRVKNEKI